VIRTTTRISPAVDEEQRLRYRRNVTGVVMVIVGVVWSVVARDTLLPERSESVEPESALAQNR
jgi:hypothetical protein